MFFLFTFQDTHINSLPPSLSFIVYAALPHRILPRPLLQRLRALTPLRLRPLTLGARDVHRTHHALHPLLRPRLRLLHHPVPRMRHRGHET